MKKKKILIALPSDIMGGAEQYLKNIAEYYNNLNYQIFVILFSAPKTYVFHSISPNIKIYAPNTSKERYGIPFFIYKIILFFFQHSFQYTFSSHTHSSGLLGFFKKIKILRTKYHVARESTSIFTRFTGLKLLEFKFFYTIGYSKHINLIICQTHFMKKQLLAALPKARTLNVQVIPNPINYNEIIEKGNINPEFEFNENYKYIVAAGRLISLKGFHHLIHAFATLNLPNYKLLILGEGSELQNLQRLIHNLHQTQNIHLLGFHKNPMPYFKKANICVVSSIIEGFPNVLLQMMALNPCVVSTLCAGDIDTIPNIITCNPDNKNELQQAIAQATSLTTQQLKQNKIVFQNFLQERTLQNFVKTIESYI